MEGYECLVRNPEERLSFFSYPTLYIFHSCLAFSTLWWIHPIRLLISGSMCTRPGLMSSGWILQIKVSDHPSSRGTDSSSPSSPPPHLLVNSLRPGDG